MKLSLRFLVGGAAVLLAGSGLLGCDDQEFTEPMSLGTMYYPLEINTQRTFAVADTAWSAGQATVTNFQFREAITDTFRDASGQKAYRVVRARRNTAAEAWKNDSVYVLTADNHAVTMVRDNRRTVELIFPVRDGQGWNQNAYNGSYADTITAINRRYHWLGRPLTLNAPGASGPKTYESTVTTLNEGDDQSLYQENEYYRTQNQQVYAKYVGPVFRHQNIYYHCRGGDPDCLPSRNYIFYGVSRTQTLIDYGPL